MHKGKVGVSFVFFVESTLTTGDDKCPHHVVGQACTIVAASADVETAPTGADLTMQIEKSSNQGGAWSEVVAPASYKIVDGSKTGEVTGLSVSLAKGDWLRFNIDQIGSGVAGADLTGLLKVEIPT